MRTIKHEQLYRAARRTNELRQQEDQNEDRETLVVIVACLLIGLVCGVDSALGFILGVIVMVALSLWSSREDNRL
jgi:predicted histidine transporter YuiF (NhaC family)